MCAYRNILSLKLINSICLFLIGRWVHYSYVYISACSKWLLTLMLLTHAVDIQEIWVLYRQGFLFFACIWINFGHTYARFRNLKLNKQELLISQTCRLLKLHIYIFKNKIQYMLFHLKSLIKCKEVWNIVDFQKWIFSKFKWSREIMEYFRSMMSKYETGSCVVMDINISKMTKYDFLIWFLLLLRYFWLFYDDCGRLCFYLHNVYDW